MLFTDAEAAYLTACRTWMHQSSRRADVLGQARRLDNLLHDLRYYPQEADPAELPAVLKAWPTPALVAEVVAAEQEAWGRMQSTWKILTEEQRLGLVPPPLMKERQSA